LYRFWVPFPLGMAFHLREFYSFRRCLPLLGYRNFFQAVWADENPVSIFLGANPVEDVVGFDATAAGLCPDSFDHRQLIFANAAILAARELETFALPCPFRSSRIWTRAW
jgi:hypothetical protein